MACDRCGEDAVIHVDYSGADLCETHFRQSVEKRVRRRIREDNLLPETATPENPKTWVIGLSGGKDSSVLTHVLAKTFDEDPRIRLIALSIHEGMEGYRDSSIEAARRLTSQLQVRHETVSYAEEFGVRMDDVVEETSEDRAACAYCGVFRRHVLSKYADTFDGDLLMIGHNLDDEAQTALMNYFEGDVEQMAKHFDASLGPLDERTLNDHHVPRAKPLRDIPENEIRLYARLADLPVHHGECPYSEDSFRGEIQSLIHRFEEDHPGTRHSIMAGYEQLARQAASHIHRDGKEYESCDTCGAPTTGGRCRKCQLLDSLDA